MFDNSPPANSTRFAGSSWRAALARRVTGSRKSRISETNSLSNSRREDTTFAGLDEYLGAKTRMANDNPTVRSKTLRDRMGAVDRCFPRRSTARQKRLASFSAGRPESLIFAFAAILVLLCSACVPVMLNAPAGDEPVRLHSDNLDGLWMRYDVRSSGDFLMAKVTVIDAEKGRLSAEITTESEKGFQITTTDLYVRKAGHWTLLSIRWPDNNFGFSTKPAPFKHNYFWGRVELNDNMLLFWPPRPDRFSDWLQKGVIEGRMRYEKPETEKHGWLEIERLDTEALERFQASESMPADYWYEPIVYIRVTNPAQVGRPRPNAPPDAQTEKP